MQRITKTQNFTANSQNMDFNVSDIGQVTFSVKGTFVATVTFYISDDAGVTYYPLFMTPSNSATAVGTATALGLFKADVTPYDMFRVSTTAYTSGTAVGKMTAVPMIH